ncbi:MAG TPA: PAS domain S-box protein [Bacteriovoracaceae bacterium]|nr:PAS domain S-box protein [Bacteriovoracaceae bacterium]
METVPPLDPRHTDHEIYEKIFNLSLDLIGVAGHDGIFKKINKCFHQTLGYSRETLLSKSFLDFVHPDDKAATVLEMEQLRRGRPTINFENRYVCSDGSYKWLEWNCVPFGSDRIITVARDITLKKMNRENFLETIIDNIPDMIFVKEAKDLRFVRFNKAGEDLLGYASTDLLGKNDYDFFPAEQAEFFIAKDRAVMTGKTMVEIAEEPIATKHRGERILHTKKIPLFNPDGSPKYLVGISEDITEKKHAEGVKQKLYEEKVGREEAERSLQTRDEFISIASHELKSPVSSLKLRAQMFKRRVDAGAADAYAPEKVDQLLELTIKQSDKIDRLVNDMLDVARIRTGVLSMERSRFNLHTLVTDVLMRLSGDFSAAGCEYEFDSTCVDVYGDWDYLRLEQVTINLLTNALRYGNGSRIKVRLSTGPRSVELSVHDQGIGIDKEQLDKVFERFERAVDRSEVSGLGLGLYISRQIVEAHDGKIWAESEAGKGTSFFVNLPVLCVQAEPRAES